VRSSLFRSGIAAAFSLLLWAAAELAAVTFMCPDGLAWVRVRSGASTVVMDRGEQIARPGDAIFTCETPHAVGPFLLHHDLGCYCASRETSAAQVSEIVGGLCAVDTLQPAPDDAGSACHYGHCSSFVDLSMAPR
jgi:hypothetical protein